MASKNNASETLIYIHSRSEGFRIYTDQVGRTKNIVFRFPFNRCLFVRC